jgi:hypothetical protein
MSEENEFQSNRFTSFYHPPFQFLLPTMDLLMNLATFTSWSMATETHSPFLRALVGTSDDHTRSLCNRRTSDVHLISIPFPSHLSSQLQDLIKIKSVETLADRLPSSISDSFVVLKEPTDAGLRFPEIRPRVTSTSSYCMVSDKSSCLNFEYLTKSSAYFNCLLLCRLTTC